MTPELRTTLKEDMGQRLGALKLSRGCSPAQWSLVLISGVAVRCRAESSREEPESKLLIGVF